MDSQSIEGRPKFLFVVDADEAPQLDQIEVESGIERGTFTAVFQLSRRWGKWALVGATEDPDHLASLMSSDPQVLPYKAIDQLRPAM